MKTMILLTCYLTACTTSSPESTASRDLTACDPDCATRDAIALATQISNQFVGANSGNERICSYRVGADGRPNGLASCDVFDSDGTWLVACEVEYAGRTITSQGCWDQQ